MDVEEDIDYYLAMEEEAQMEEPDFEEGWDNAQENEEQQAEGALPTGDFSVVPAPAHPPPVKVNANHPTNPAPVAVAAAPKISRTFITSVDESVSTVMLKKGPMNPKEFALAMQAERRKALGEGDSTQKGSSASRKVQQLETESSLYTTRPAFQPCDDASQYVHSRPPATADLIAASGQHLTATPFKHAGTSFVTCVLADGSQAYLYKRRAGGVYGPSPAPVTSSAPKPLLAKPMDELMREADALKVKALLLRDKVMAEKREREVSAAEPALFQSSQDVPAGDGEESLEAESGSLWVDKYAPRGFTQLLSPEKINREVLKALKKWDRFVFKTDNHTADDAEAGKSALTGSATKPKPASAAIPAGAAAVGAVDGAEDCRPRNKVILLCGPPGTGKTTLAHIVARHCGYTPVEVNASDDRSPERLKELIYSATQNATLLAAAKPNCVILDEIDGIDGSRNALDVLTNIIKAPLKSGAGAAGGKGKAAAGTFPLTRPLICICNDQYAPALRELTKLADIFVFSAPQDVRLIQRLRQVCKQEGLHVGNSAFIAELCSATGHDIRASINNLQFAALKSSKQLQQQKVAAESAGTGAGAGAWGSAFGAKSAKPDPASHETKQLDIGAVLHGMIRSGLKDDSLDLAQIWRQIFTLANPAAATAAASSTGAANGSAGDSALEQATAAAAAAKALRVDHSMRAMDAMLSYGDHQQVIGGIFENVHSMEALDPNMNKHCAAAEWLSFSEELNSFMPRARDGFQLSPYVAAVAGAIYCHCAVGASRRPKVEWPRKDREMHFKGVQKRNILQSLCDGSSIHALLTSPQRVVLDLLPYLLDVISPPLGVRALPFITLPAPEQLAIQDTVRVMESCGISYLLGKAVEVEKKPEGGYKPFVPYGQQNNLVLKLDPAFEQLLEYPECEELALRHRQVSQEMRQLLHTEQRKLSIQLKAHKLDNDSGDSANHAASNAVKATSSAVAAPAPVPTAAPLDTASTPFLIMQQQQRDSALSKRQHSGVMGSFFAKSTVAPVAKKTKVADPAVEAAQDKKAAFNANSVRFKFNQGFSNAVKRTVLMDEFL